MKLPKFSKSSLLPNGYTWSKTKIIKKVQPPTAETSLQGLSQSSAHDGALPGSNAQPFKGKWKQLKDTLGKFSSNQNELNANASTSNSQYYPPSSTVSST